VRPHPSEQTTVATKQHFRPRHDGPPPPTCVGLRGPAVDGIAASFTQNWTQCHDLLFDEHDRFVERRPSGDATVRAVRGSSVSVGRTCRL
jgi:hypothetical protein